MRSAVGRSKKPGLAVPWQWRLAIKLQSTEVLLEQPAPLQSFQGRRGPEPWEQSGSKLLDERWLEVFMWRLKSKDSYLESRKRLTHAGGKGKSESSGGAQPKSEREKEKEKPRKGSQKGKDGKKEKGSQEADPSAS